MQARHVTLQSVLPTQMFACTDRYSLPTVGGSRISQKEKRQPQMGGSTYYLPNFPPKLRENEEIWAERGPLPCSSSLNPPMTGNTFDILEETFDWRVCEKVEHLILDSHETPAHHGDCNFHRRSYACENIYPKDVCWRWEILWHSSVSSYI